MYTFPELIKTIRNKAGLTQPEFARKLEVSSALIAMIETGQKEVSKNFTEKLAKKLDVHPASITPFLFFDDVSTKNLSGIERKIIEQAEKLQLQLIEKKVELLR